ncbi:hypothetical protein IWX76_000983 [Pedobacter sp. CAN_A7]|uniref:helix-turn-helix transcriptional regulator n=1 Tax=Pedobacter sp. CAN_A7 TaxID=2787722 RepID=UPI0018CA00A8
MKQLDRLKYIYLSLNTAPQTMESIQANLMELGVKISSRQIYRDLADVSTYFLRGEERLEQRSLEFNRKVWLINKHIEADPITNYDINTYLISRITMPIGLTRGREESLQKLQTLISNNLNNSKLENNASWIGNSITSSNFNEFPYAENFHGTLDEILWATSNRRSIEVISYLGDSVSLYKSLKFPFIFNPIKLIYHRGSFFVAGLIDATQQCVVLDSYQIEQYKLTNNLFPVKSALKVVENNLKNRFGVTQNIDEQVYQVILEVASTTAKFLRNVFWHHSQQFVELPHGNWQLTLTCGINRELIGWIFQWMGNVKIIQPEILRTFFSAQLQVLENTHQKPEFNYSNPLQPE